VTFAGPLKKHVGSTKKLCHLPHKTLGAIFYLIYGSPIKSGKILQSMFCGKWTPFFRQVFPMVYSKGHPLTVSWGNFFLPLNP
jgi:hypothetical protein